MNSKCILGEKGYAGQARVSENGELWLRWVGLMPQSFWGVGGGHLAGQLWHSRSDQREDSLRLLRWRILPLLIRHRPRAEAQEK